MTTYRDIISKIEKKIYSPVYFLWGEESFYIDKITNYIEENVLTASEKDFNFTVFYGKDSTPEEIINVCRRFPMMSNYQVVIVKEAQNLKQIEKLGIYFSNPLKTTVLVINYKGKVDKRKKFFINAKKYALVFESPQIKGDKVNAWINTYLSEKGFSITPKAATMLEEFLGTDLSKIANELDKLIILITDAKTITEDHIEENIGISKDFNIFELLNAVGQGNKYKSFFIANHFGQNPKEHPFVMTVSLLAQYFSKILIYHSIKDKADRNTLAAKLGVNAYFLKDYYNAARLYSVSKLVDNISLLREYDMKSKGVNSIESDQGELLKELVFRLMN